MRLRNYASYRRAVSPVIAVILLVALTVSTGALVWAITNDVISIGGADELVLENSGVGDNSGNRMGDTIRMIVRNIGASEAVLEDIFVYVDGEQAYTWVLNGSYTILNGQQGEIYAQTINTGDMVLSTNTVEVQFDTERSISGKFTITVPSLLSSIAILYDSGFAFTTEDLAAQGWTQHQIGSHSGGSGGIGFEVVPSNPNEITVTTNNDLLFILENPDFSIRNFIISTEITNGDNDFLGIAFRYIDVDNYYWVGVTSDHHSSRNRAGDPTNGNIPYAGRDRNAIIFGKVENGVTSRIDVSAVDPSLAGTVNQISWTKTFMLAVGDNSFALLVDGEEFIQISDTTFPNAGYVGFIGLASHNSRFGNILIQS
ncbi:MAG: archaellin/type IV pilin N-terminal domain-containing protein [Candidatus Kariarchaeaceae archaeon]|jgi:flagellin-like protein